MFVVGIGRRLGPMIIHRSSALVRTGSIRFSVAMISAAFRQATRVESWGSPRYGSLRFPHSRIIATVLSAPMLVSLVAMNYHFVSDVIAGSALGAIVATYAAHLARLETP